MLLLDRRQIVERLKGENLIGAIEEAFAAYSAGLAVVPEPGELLFADPPGEVHIKYGYIRAAPYFVVKVASGFYNNHGLGLSNSQGIVLVFDSKTGAEVAILRDEGVLTDIRTAVAGAIAAKYLAPSEITHIGVLGAGIQAQLQVEYLQSVRPCRRVVVWNRTPAKAELYREVMTEKGYEVAIADTPAIVCEQAEIIITTTASHEPLINYKMLRPGTHVTAIGADTIQKTEIDPDVIAKANDVVVDSRAQCGTRGELAKAVAASATEIGAVRELGEVIRKGLVSRSPSAISIAILTGLAVQDLAMGRAVIDANAF